MTEMMRSKNHCGPTQEKARRSLFFTFLPFYLFIFISLSCSHRSPAELAGKVAQQYYQQLIKGDYESFVDGTYQPEAIPPSYRSQLIDNAKMFVGRQQSEHRGIRDVRLANATTDSLETAASVYLVFCYGDSTAEEVLVPMVLHEGTWYLK